MTTIKQYSADKESLTMAPFAGRQFVIEQGLDGCYLTGLTKEQEKRLGKILGKNLENTNAEFWDDYQIKFYMPQLSMKVDEKTPQGEIFLAVAKANKLLAENEEQLLSDMELKRKTIFYIHDSEEIEKRRFKFIELKDEVSQLVYQMRNDGDKMLYVLFKLGKTVSHRLPTSSLYNMLSSHKEKITKFEPMSDFKELLTTSNIALQAFFYAKLGFKYSVIVFDMDLNQYRFQSTPLGATESKVIENLGKKDFEVTLYEIINEVKERSE